jgi:hypothetical protein
MLSCLFSLFGLVWIKLYTTITFKMSNPGAGYIQETYNTELPLAVRIQMQNAY